MRDVIYVKLDIVYPINQQLNETISRKSYFLKTVKSKVIISLFETVRLSVSISPRNLYNSLKSIKRKFSTKPVKVNSTLPETVYFQGKQFCHLLSTSFNGGQPLESRICFPKSKFFKR